MDPYWYALACVVIGGILGVVIPYLFKVMDGDLKFSYSYFYGLCVSMVVSAVALIPEPVGVLTGQAIMMLVLAGYGIQQVANMITTKVRKGTNE